MHAKDRAEWWSYDTYDVVQGPAPGPGLDLMSARVAWTILNGFLGCSNNPGQLCTPLTN